MAANEPSYESLVCGQRLHRSGHTDSRWVIVIAVNGEDWNGNIKVFVFVIDMIQRSTH